MTYLYHYDNQGLNRNIRTEARMSPLDPTVPLVPRNATLIEPIIRNKLYVILSFNRTFNAWEEISDYRDYYYWTPQHGDAVITEVGISLPAGAIKHQDGVSIIWDENFNAWRTTTAEDDLKTEQEDFENYKLKIIEANDLKAEELKAEFFDEKYNSNELRNKQFFYIVRGIELKTAETLTADEQIELDTLLMLVADIRAIILVNKTNAIAVKATLTEDTADIAGIINWPIPGHDKTITIN